MNKKSEHNTLQGISLGGGVSIGPAFQFRQLDLQSVKLLVEPVEDVALELERLQRAVTTSASQVETLLDEMRAEGRKDAEQIFMSQQMMLRDVCFLDGIRHRITMQRLNSEYVLADELEKLKTNFDLIQHEAMATKMLDIQDAFHRLLRNLLEIEHVRTSPMRNLSEKVILVAKKLLPSDVVLLEKNKLLGILVEAGSTVSHVAIIARSLGIPVIMNIPGLTTLVSTGTTLVIDGDIGEVIVAPDEEQVRDVMERLRTHLVLEKTREAIPCITHTGVRIRLEANAGSIKDIEEAMGFGAEGIGLLRSELYFLGFERMPSEEEEITFYEDAMRAGGEHALTIRLMDIGADKMPNYFPIPPEEEPLLGTRGVRYLLRYPQILERQLRCLVRARKTRSLKILVPMVSLPTEMIAVRTALQRVCKEEGDSGQGILVGMMVEVPATALGIRGFLDTTDFISIGTNDLSQYLFAASRENAHMENFREAAIPLLLELIGNICVEAKAKSIPVTVCGELASHAAWAKSLAGLGVAGISMQSHAISSIFKALTTPSC